MVGKLNERGKQHSTVDGIRKASDPEQPHLTGLLILFTSLCLFRAVEFSSALQPNSPPPPCMILASVLSRLAQPNRELHLLLPRWQRR